MIIGFTCGAFDLLHTGHVLMLEQCKSHCDTLIVGLHTDPTIDRKQKNKPIQTTFERYAQLHSCKFVDSIIPYDTEKDLENILNIYPINVRFVGSDHRYSILTGQEICEKRGIEIKVIERFHTYSTSELRNRICQQSPNISKKSQTFLAV